MRQSDHDLLIRVDQKVDTLHEKISLLTDDHEKRIRMVERNQWRWSGASGVIGAALSFAANLAVSHFAK